MDLIELPDLLIRLPDGGQAGSLCGHYIDADPEVRAQLLHARAYELHNFIVHISVAEGSSDDGQSHILRPYSLHGLAVQVDTDHLRHLDIISFIQKLLNQLRSALAHGHGSQGAVAGVAVRSQDHLAAACQHFPGILMDNCLMRGHIDAAVLLGAGQSKHVVIFIDGAAYRAQGIVAVGKHIGDGELLQTGSSRRLDDPHKCNIVGSQLVKLDLQPLHIPGGIVLLQDVVGHSLLGRLFPGNVFSGPGFCLLGALHDLCTI